MPDVPKAPASGPDGLLRTDAPPTRGQLASIATLAGVLLGFDLDSRYDATLALVRLQGAVQALPDRHGLPDVPPL